MKTKFTTMVVFLLVSILSVNALVFSDNIQEKKTLTVQGTFDGYDADDGYAFLILDVEDDSEEIIYFTEITEEALKAVNLKSKEMTGKRFEITYEVTEYDEMDENGYVETFEKYKIIQLKKL